jgi:C-5 cytosine-specific DNA methylase
VSAVKPLMIDLFAGLGGWAEGGLAEGFDVVGFDIECHAYGEHRYPAQLVLQDVLTLHGSQFKDAALIVASPPCQAYSYRAMPWKRAKALPPPDNSLFDACFRIQREACSAAGHHVPLIVENVRGAQPWVGRSRWNYGSYHLWGDVPALMPMTLKRGQKVLGFRFDGSGKSFQTASVDGVKVGGLDWSKHGTLGYAEGPGKRSRDSAKVESLDGGRRTDPGKGARFTSRDCGVEGQKNAGGSWFSIEHGRPNKGRNDPRDEIKCGGDWFGPGEDASAMRHQSSRSHKRKAASAMIAKIPLTLARYIARTYHP